MGETEIIVVATLSSLASLIFIIVCCLRRCLKKRMTSQLVQTDSAISDLPNRSSVSEQSHINKPQPKDIEPKDSTDYRELNKEFDEMDKNAMKTRRPSIRRGSSWRLKRCQPITALWIRRATALYDLYNKIGLLFSMNYSDNSIEPQLLRLYRIIKPVAETRHSCVWVVKDRCNNTTHSLKKVCDVFGTVAQSKRLHNQLSILAQCQHPNIIRLDRVFRACNDSDLYLIMQYAQTNLSQLIKEDILKPAQKRFIVYQLLVALKYLHSGGVVHGNLATQHILVNSLCGIKLCGFGLARSVGNDSDEAREDRCYNPPEVLLAKSYSKAADVWGLGCVIVEILTGRQLMKGQTLEAQMTKVIEFTGQPTESEIQSMENSKGNTRQLLKIFGSVQKKSPLKHINSQLIPILTQMLQFNPNKRPRVEQALLSPIFRQFRGIYEQPICKNPIEIETDPHSDYRRLIYQGIKKRYGTLTTDYERYIEQKYSSPAKSVHSRNSSRSIPKQNTQPTTPKIKKNHFTVFSYVNYFVSSQHYKTHLKKEILKTSERANNKGKIKIRKNASSLKM